MDIKEFARPTRARERLMTKGKPIERTHIVGKPLVRYEQSIKFNNHMLWFRTTLVDDLWADIVEFLSMVEMTAYNEGVNDTRHTVKEALGLNG